MEQVAHHLQTTAIGLRTNPEAFDQFGRSAFNRYYYSVFLIVRDLVLEFNPNWSATHSSVPGLLRGSFTENLAKFRAAANKRGNNEQSQSANQAIAALASLAVLMEQANKLRVTADYNPAIKVDDRGGERFALASVSITDAHQWPARAKLQARTIRRALRLARGTV